MSSRRDSWMLITLALGLILLAACSEIQTPTPTSARPVEPRPTETAKPTATGPPPGVTLVPTVEPHPTNTEAPAATHTAQPVTDQAWAQIQAKGKLVVGTAADYPPFAYYTEDFQVDGFDVALIREIGQRLGVKVELYDFAFDGLDGALMLKQIDVAIAALSITPQREAVVDFSNVYYAGEDGILAHQDSDIHSITRVQEMAGWRIGVQRGTVYQDWLTKELVKTGLMPAGNLFLYEKGEDAVQDLKDGRLDLVVGDALPAEVAVGTGGVRLVGRGLNVQRFGIAVRRGETSLKNEIDRTLRELQKEGRISELARQYLELESIEIPPTLTPAPIPSSTPEPPHRASTVWPTWRILRTTTTT